MILVMGHFLKTLVGCVQSAITILFLPINEVTFSHKSLQELKQQTLHPTAQPLTSHDSYIIILHSLLTLGTSNMYTVHKEVHIMMTMIVM